LFPSAYTTSSERELEEERRLFYVAITRAEEMCFISYSKSRFRNGKSNFANPSRFIKDIDSQYLDLPKEPEFEPKQSRFRDWDDDMEFERNRFKQSAIPKPISFDTNLPIAPKRLSKIESSADTVKIPITNSPIPVNSFVKHAVFGIGKVLEISMVNGNEKAEIDFGEKGVKSLLLKFAKLEIME
jgi:DNA helicase-2/ATP-dependent DNA helicase PcrA